MHEDTKVIKKCVNQLSRYLGKTNVIKSVHLCRQRIFFYTGMLPRPLSFAWKRDRFMKWAQH